MQDLIQIVFRLSAHFLPVLACIFFGMIFADSPDCSNSAKDNDDWYFDESNKDGFWKGKDK